MNLVERLTAVLGVGPSQRNFREKMLRYFAGDLDRVERRAFEVEIMSSNVRKRVFAAEYDVRTRDLGLLSLGVADPDLSECFSIQTLEAYARGQLSPEDHRLVDHHLPCPLCGAQIRSLRDEVPHRVEVTWGERLEELLGRLMGLLMRPGSLVAATAAVLMVVVVGKMSPEPQPADAPRVKALDPSAKAVPPVATSPKVSAFRSVSDGAASLSVLALTSDGAQIAIDPEEDVRLPIDARLQIRGENTAIEQARYFALFSLDENDQPSWHVPAWDGQIPPGMEPIEPGQEGVWSQAVPNLAPGHHRLGLLISPERSNLARIRSALTVPPEGQGPFEALEALTGERSTLVIWQVDVP